MWVNSSYTFHRLQDYRLKLVVWVLVETSYSPWSFYWKFLIQIYNVGNKKKQLKLKSGKYKMSLHVIIDVRISGKESDIFFIMWQGSTNNKSETTYKFRGTLSSDREHFRLLSMNFADTILTATAQLPKWAEYMSMTAIALTSTLWKAISKFPTLLSLARCFLRKDIVESISWNF